VCGENKGGEMKTEQYNTDTNNGRPTINRDYKVYEFKDKKPTREMTVGVSEDGYIFISTRLKFKNKWIVNKVCYSKEAVGHILSAVFSGCNAWHGTRGIKVDAK
jgi:hypothetical protein